MLTNLDFDYLSKLYQTDPEKFEALRANEIKKLIDEASDSSKRRLQGVQFQIDAKREIHKNSPIGACIAISTIMHESFDNLRFHLNQAVNNKDPLSHQPYPSKTTVAIEERSAKVFKLPKHSND